MIASIEGKITGRGKDFLIVAANGIGYKVFAPFSTRDEAVENEMIFLHTTLVVREDSFSLYGFGSPSERDVFETLLSVSGVGPKMALAILSTLSVDNLRNAVLSERAEILTRVPGVGKKTAQKILLDIKDKFGGGLDAVPAEGFDDLNGDVLDTLVALGYSIVEAQTAIQSLPKDAPKDVEARVRLALQYFLQ